MALSGRVFGASLKPAWNSIKIESFLNDLKGTAKVYIINHDKDTSDDGEIIEKHTHVYIEYDTPRKVTTVSNLLNVEPNFIEVIKNKKGYIRYLTHMDDLDKYQYDSDDVFTNSIQYNDIVLGSSLTDREIAEYISAGRGIELLGVVSASKLRTIQSFMHFDNSNMQIQLLKELNIKFDTVVSAIQKVEDMALDFTVTFGTSVEGLAGGLLQVAEELGKVRKLATRKRK